MMILYEGTEPGGPYKLKVKARRLRKVRFNDLITPLPIPLDIPYGVLIEADRPVIVQFSRLDTSAMRHAITGGMAYPVEESD